MTHTSYYVADARLSEATYRVACGGELDLAARSELSQALARATSSGAENLELDRQLTAAHAPHVFDVYRGAHETSLWQAHAIPWLRLALRRLAPATR